MAVKFLVMSPTKALHILLTNDDGHEAPGILAMREALKAHGYRVSMVAPSSEQSASGMSTTMRGTIGLESLDEGRWHIDARPADTVLVALRHLLRDDPPELVVSGINFGPNLGLGLHASGTVGAALMALLHGLPAIAISAGISFQEARQTPPSFPSTHGVLEPAGRFTCQVIESLCRSRGQDGHLLPEGIMLNINYPPLPPGSIKGVLFPQVSDDHLIELAYLPSEVTGRLEPRYRAGIVAERPDLRAGDLRAHMEGYITVSPVRPSWNASPEESRVLQQRLKGLSLRADGTESQA